VLDIRWSIHLTPDDGEARDELSLSPSPLSAAATGLAEKVRSINAPHLAEKVRLINNIDD